MVRSRPILSLVVYVVVAMTSLSAANSTPSSNNSGLRPPKEPKCHNMYTYNSFYAGANKKIEALLREMKNELSEIREEIQSLKGNKTFGKGQ